MLRLSWLLWALVLFSCTKEAELTVLEVTNEKIESVDATRITISYDLSRLGYTKSVLTVSKRQSGSTIINKEAVRQGKRFFAYLENLEPNTEYRILISNYEGDNRSSHTKEIIVKTLEEGGDLFTFRLSTGDTVFFQERGEVHFTIDANILQYDLADFTFHLYDTQHFWNGVGGAPYFIPLDVQSGKNGLPPNVIQLIAVGRVYPNDTETFFDVRYKGKLIHRKIINLHYYQKRVSTVFNETNIAFSHDAIAYKDKYYFTGLGSGFTMQFYQSDTHDGFKKVLYYDAGNVELDFPASVVIGDKAFAGPIEKDVNSYTKLRLNVACFDFEKKQLRYYPLEEEYSWQDYYIKDKSNFVYKGEVYSLFSLIKYYNGGTAEKEYNIKSYLYKFNKAADRFEKVRDFNWDLRDFTLTIIGGELIIVGYLPVYDQGLLIGRTISLHYWDIESNKLSFINAYRNNGKIFYNNHGNIRVNNGPEAHHHEGYLYFLVENNMIRYNIEEKRWDDITIKGYWINSLFVKNNKLYCFVYNNGIKELTLKII